METVVTAAKMTGSTAMRPNLSYFLRSIAIVVALPLMVFWGWFAFLAHFFLISERAAIAGVGLFVITAVGVLLSAGIFGFGGMCRWLAMLLVGGFAAFSAWLYPTRDLEELKLLLPVCDTAQIIGVSVVIAGAAGCIMRRSENANHKPMGHELPLFSDALKKRCMGHLYQATPNQERS